MAPPVPTPEGPEVAEFLLPAAPLAAVTSAIAVAAATHGQGEVVVRFPGGDLRVRLEGDSAWLTGPAEPVDESSASHDEVATPA